MAKKQDKDAKKSSIFSWKRYIFIFVFIAFVVTSSFLLFFSSFEISYELVRKNALLTCGNVFFMSFLVCLVDGFQRKLTIQKPVKKILDATDQLAKGEFDTRIGKLGIFRTRTEFDEIAENIDKLAGELNGIETLRTDFVSNVSHEIKTPIAVIGNYSTMLQKKDITDEERIKYASSISDATKRLSDLITNILKLNKLENQQIYPEISSYNLSEQLCECVLGFEKIWEEKEIELDTDIEDDVRINADPELLSLVWNNLLSNAFKFTPQGGTVKVVLKGREDGAIVSVEDSGCGISEDDLNRIFDRFYQADRSHATQGNGLGLALVKRVANIFGAEVGVESALGQGTKFTIMLHNHGR